MKIPILVALALSIQPQTDNQFDLNCVGIEKITENGKHEENPWVENFRIDLGAGFYCRGECKTLIPVVSANPSEITLRSFIHPSGISSIMSFLNRIDGTLLEFGHYDLVTKNRTVEFQVSAKCEKRPFSGLPKRKF
jgi:hypothetical protein